MPPARLSHYTLSAPTHRSLSAHATAQRLNGWLAQLCVEALRHPCFSQSCRASCRLQASCVLTDTPLLSLVFSSCFSTPPRPAVLKELFDMIVAVGEPRPGGAGAAARAPAAADAAEKSEAGGSSSGAAAAPVAELPAAGDSAVASAASETVTGKKRKRAEAEEAAPAASAGTKLARTDDADSDADEGEGLGGSAGAGSAKGAPKLKALVLQRLQAAKLEGDARVKAKSLRKACVAAAVAGGRYADEDAAGAAFDKTLGKLSGRGKLALSEDGKYATVA